MKRISHRIRTEEGFTLLEVLAVVAILGILAATSYAVFLGQDKNAFDTEAKSHARSLLWKVQVCFTAREDYTLCDEPTEQEPPPGVVWGDGPGEVEVVQAETSRYRVTVRALSQARTGDAHHSFTIVKEVGEKDLRMCSSDVGENQAGGCSGGTW